jgi:hypothetical protein
MEWKEIASAAAQATEDLSSIASAKEDARCCRNCMHSEPVHGSEQFRLICSNRSGYRGQWYLVGTDDVCARFKQAIDAAVLPPGARMIPLTQGRFALVDEADYADLIRHSWCVSRMGYKKSANQKTLYAVRMTNQRQTIRMHRQIMAAGPGQIVDHINHNGLDNRRCNLRICTQAKNIWNQRGQRGRTSRYKGVFIHRQSAKWRAAICHKGKRYYLGYFDSETAAARAYNAKARELFGEFAYLNDI